MKKITPFLWFDDNALEAAEFFVPFFHPRRIRRGRVMQAMLKMGKIVIKDPGKA